MAITDAQKKATYKYREKIEELRFQVPKGQKDIIKDHADKQGESVSSFVYRAVKETMERDNKKNKKKNLTDEEKAEIAKEEADLFSKSNKK